MSRHSKCCILLFLLLPILTQAQPLMLAWDFPRDCVPMPDNFILAQVQSGGRERQARVALSAEGACTWITDQNRDTFCSLTQCPAAGTIVAYWVYAQYGQTFSPPSNILTCSTKPGEPCRCADPLYAVSPPSLPPAPTPPPPGITSVPPVDMVSVAPVALAVISPLVPLFQIPAAPASGGA